MEKRTTLSSLRILELKKKRRRALKIKIFIILFLLVALLIGSVFVLRVPELNIDTENFEIKGNKIIDTEFLEKTIKEELAGYYFYFIPKTSVLLFPKNKIEARLADDFKRLEKIKVSIKDKKVLELVVTERKATYTWCGEDIFSYAEVESTDEILEKRKCYFMNEEGYVFGEAPYFSGDVYLKFFGPLSGAEEEDKTSDEISDSQDIVEFDPKGKYFLPDKFSRIVFFLDSIKSMNLKPASFVVMPDDEVELYLASEIPPPHTPKVIFKTDADLMKVAENLQASISTEPLKSDLKNKYSSLLYIDLRFGNKIYYKFKTNEMTND